MPMLVRSQAGTRHTGSGRLWLHRSVAILALSLLYKYSRMLQRESQLGYSINPKHQRNWVFEFLTSSEAKDRYLNA